MGGLGGIMGLFVEIEVFDGLWFAPPDLNLLWCIGPVHRALHRLRWALTLSYVPSPPMADMGKETLGK